MTFNYRELSRALAIRLQASAQDSSTMPRLHRRLDDVGRLTRALLRLERSGQVDDPLCALIVGAGLLPESAAILRLLDDDAHRYPAVIRGIAVEDLVQKVGMFGAARLPFALKMFEPGGCLASLGIKNEQRIGPRGPLSSSAAFSDDCLKKLGHTTEEAVDPKPSEAFGLPGSESRRGKKCRFMSTEPESRPLLLSPTLEQQFERLVCRLRRRISTKQTGAARRILGNRPPLVVASGPPGTGKSLAGVTLARKLDLKVVQLTAGELLHSHVGETEKAMTRLFHEARRGDKLIILDEADAFLTSRLNATRSWERGHTNHLLSLLDSFQGAAVYFTTNMAISKIDEAFARRMTARLEFKTPDSQTRLKILRAMTKEILTLDGVALTSLANQFALTGGELRNAVQVLLELSDEEQPTVNMRQFREAMQDVLRRRTVDQDETQIGFHQ